MWQGPEKIDFFLGVSDVSHGGGGYQMLDRLQDLSNAVPTLFTRRSCLLDQQRRFRRRGEDLREPGIRFMSQAAQPQSPQVALDPAGIPIFSLVWYRRPVDQLTEEERKTRLGGGLLTFSAELTRTEEQEQEIREAIASDPAVHQQLERRQGGAAAIGNRFPGIGCPSRS